MDDGTMGTNSGEDKEMESVPNSDGKGVYRGVKPERSESCRPEGNSFMAE